MDHSVQPKDSGCCCEAMPESLAIATVPCQKFGHLYEDEKALFHGTVFPALDLPFFAGGDAK